jgi:hypothetical protein
VSNDRGSNDRGPNDRASTLVNTSLFTATIISWKVLLVKRSVRFMAYLLDVNMDPYTHTPMRKSILCNDKMSLSAASED